MHAVLLMFVTFWIIIDALHVSGNKCIISEQMHTQLDLNYEHHINLKWELIININNRGKEMNKFHESLHLNGNEITNNSFRSKSMLFVLVRKGQSDNIALSQDVEKSYF